jgi:hypothetical protein
MRLVQLGVTQFFPLLLHQAVEAEAHLTRLEMLAALVVALVVMLVARLVELELQVKETQGVLAHRVAAVEAARVLLVVLLMTMQML